MGYNYEIIKRKRKRAKKLLVKYMGGKCQCCGYDACNEALHMHHIDPLSKKFTLSQCSKSWDSLIDEAKKCILLCSRCHDEYHAGYRKLPEKYSTLDEEAIRKEICREARIYIKECRECAVTFKTKKQPQKFCSVECSRKAGRKVKRPDKEVINSLLKTNSMVSVGKMYGVSDNAIRKWLKY